MRVPKIIKTAIGCLINLANDGKRENEILLL